MKNLLSFGSVIMGVIVKIRIFVWYQFGIQGGSETPRTVLKKQLFWKISENWQEKVLNRFLSTKCAELNVQFFLKQ